jgi:hypothetical protein
MFVVAASVFAVWMPAAYGGEGVIIFFALISGATLGVFWVIIGPLCVKISELVRNWPRYYH